MELGTALDVAIGLVLMYVLLSLSVTAIVEYMSQIFDLRSRNLQDTLQRLLQSDMLAMFEGTGQIASMKAATKGEPSYLDSAVFAKAIADVAKLRNDAGAVAANAFQTIERLPDGPVKAVMIDEWRRAKGEIEKFEQAMADWFDKAMQRASGIFKRWTQWIALATGIAIAAMVNADTFAVGLKLWQDEALRAQMTAVAESVAGDESFKNGSATMEQIKGELKKLPLGWGHSEPPKDSLAWVVKAIGIVFTGLALAFGAPFWFDILSKLVQLRSSGGKPETAVEKKKAT
jgi:hypothetical protein